LGRRQHGNRRPDLSAPRSLFGVSLVGKDYDILADELSRMPSR